MVLASSKETLCFFRLAAAFRVPYYSHPSTAPYVCISLCTGTWCCTPGPRFPFCLFHQTLVGFVVDANQKSKREFVEGFFGRRSLQRSGKELLNLQRHKCAVRIFNIVCKWRATLKTKLCVEIASGREGGH